MQFTKQLTLVAFNDDPSRDGKVFAKGTFTDGRDIIANVYIPAEHAPIFKSSMMQALTVTIGIKQKDLGKVSIYVAGVTL